MSLTPPYLYGCSKLQLVVDQRTETFFIFADLCLTKKAANILLVRSGAFWIWRPLGLSKELKDDKCLGLSKELNDDKGLVLSWSFTPTLTISKLVMLDCTCLDKGDADGSLPSFPKPLDEGLVVFVSPRVNSDWSGLLVLEFSETKCHWRVFADE